MPQSAVQAQSHEISGGWSDGEERHAPNGHTAVLVDNWWAGYLFEESETGRGTSRSIALFDVRRTDTGLAIKYLNHCRGKPKKTLEKHLHYRRDYQLFEAVTTNGLRCQLFTR